MTTESFDAERHVAHMETAMGLTIRPEWRPVVVGHVAAIAKAAESIMSFDLPEEIEPAEVYRP